MLPPDYTHRVYAGVLGKMIGVYSGRPFEQWHQPDLVRRFGTIDRYVAAEHGVPLVVADDDLSGTFTFIRALEDHRCSADLSAAEVGLTWLNYIIESRSILWWGGMGISTEHTAFNRLRAGIKPPHSGSIAANGPVVAQQIGAQIFTDGWGLVSPGNPRQAAALARAAGSVSHDGEALHGAAVVAALVAHAFVETDLERLLASALELVPRDSLIASLARDIEAWHREEPDDWYTTLLRIRAKWGYERYGGGCHILPNHALIHLALRYSAGDFHSAITIVNTAGYDTDCNAANVGCILGVRNGLGALSARYDWRGPVADRLLLPTADAGEGITDAARVSLRLVALGHRLAGFEPPPPPRDGARFHFGLPGSVQGFLPDGGHATVTPHPEGIEIGFRFLNPDLTTAAHTPTFHHAGPGSQGGYNIVASPTLHPGHVLHATVAAPDSNRGAIDIALTVWACDDRDAPAALSATPTRLPPGTSAELRWTVPDTGGQPILRVGLQLSGAAFHSGSILLRSLDWRGAPATRLRVPTAGRAHLNAWCQSATGFTLWNPKDPMRLSHDLGQGLLYQGTREWHGYRATAEGLRSRMFARAGLVANVRGLLRWHGITVTRDGRLQLLRRHDDNLQVLADAPCAVADGETLPLWIESSGARLLGGLGGDLVLEARIDPSEGCGAAGCLIEEGMLDFTALTIAPV